VSARQQAETIEQEGHAALENLRVHPVHAKRLPADTKAALVADAKLHTPRGIVQTLRYTTPYVTVRDRAHELQVPTLLVCGAYEKRFAVNRAFAERAIPGLQVVGAPAGHAVNIEAAEVFNAAVVDFIGQYI
jgi:pimeloyl-ACP methyl ester carboxylesterase